MATINGWYDVERRGESMNNLAPWKTERRIMPRKRKTEGPSKVDLMWDALERDYEEHVKNEVKTEFIADSMERLRRLRASGLWTREMVESLRAVLEGLM